MTTMLLNTIGGRDRPRRGKRPDIARLIEPVRPGWWRNLRGVLARYERKRSLRLLGFSMAVSAALHLVILLGFNAKPAPVPVAVEPEAAVIQLVAPDWKELEEEQRVEQLSDEEAVEAPGLAVPSLNEVPTVVPLNAWVQPIEIPPPVVSDWRSAQLTTIPVQLSRSVRATMGKLGTIFDPSQLDRVPEPIFQPAPVFPLSLRKEYPEASVTVSFVVTSQGQVVAPYVVRGAHYQFEQAALAGVEKWKFRPGLKGGRRVNSKIQIEIKFRVMTEIH